MTTLGPQTILQRRPNLDIHVDASNELRISSKVGTIYCGSDGLRVLDAFAWPTSVQAATDRLNARSPEHWIQVTGTIALLHSVGILCDPAAGAALVTRPALGFASPSSHVLMLNDRVRTSAFLRGVQDVVRPGDVVVDIGTGSGVLAMAAARAGAARVYAIEGTSIAEVAERAFRDNGLSDRITLVHGWSSEIELPERADVLVSETIGNDPLNERLLELTRDARARLLKPTARLVPSRVAVMGLPVTIPESRIHRHVATPPVLEQWRDWYGLDFTALAERARRSSMFAFRLGAQHAAEWPVIAEPLALSKLDLESASTSVVADARVEGRATTSGVLNGVIMYFDATLGSRVLSTHPARASAHNSWSSLVWHFPDARAVAAGDRFALRYQFGRPSDLSQVTLEL